MKFFFIKQKTAYEMRISDWSSDVCSSDLDRAYSARRGARAADERIDRRQGADRRARAAPRFRHRYAAHRARGAQPARGRERSAGRRGGAGDEARGRAAGRGQDPRRRAGRGRSEEHTSELQSLMRSSYAVFCLKKKKKAER